MLGPERDHLHPILYLVLGILAVLTFLVVAPLWAFIFGGLLVGYLGYPVFSWIHDRLDRRALSAALAMIVLASMILVPTGFLGYRLVVEAQGLAEGFTTDDARQMLEGGANLTRTYLGWPDVDANQTTAEAVIDQVVPRGRQALLNWLPNAAGFLGEFGIGVTVVLFIGYYTLRDGDHLVRFVEDLLPLHPETEKRLLDEVAGSLDAVVFGQVMTAIIQGGLTGVGFWVFGVPAPVLWGFLTAVLSLLPVIGPPLVWGPAGVVLIIQGHTGRGVGLLVWGALLVSLIDNVVKPKIMSERSGMHPTLALLGVIGGLIAFGFMGFILGPVILAVFIVMLKRYMAERQEAAIQEGQLDRVLTRLSEADGMDVELDEELDPDEDPVPDDDPA